MANKDLEDRIARAAAAQHGVISRRQLRRLGGNRNLVARRLRAGLLREAAPGVLVLTPAPVTWCQRLTVATLAGAGAVGSRRSAARLHGLDSFLRDPRVEVSVPAPRRGGGRGVLTHRVVALEPSDVPIVDGIAVTTLARTLADLGSVVGADRVLKALDDARRRGLSATALEGVVERLHRPGQRGTGVLRDLLADARSEQRVPDSWFERVIERCLAVPGIPPLVRQFVVRDERGRFVARVDAAMPAVRLAIEGHSRAFHFGAGPERADEDRDLRLAAIGWEVLHVGWQATKQPEALANVIRRAVRSRS